MAGPIRISILANAAQAKRELNSVSGSASSMGSKFKKFGAVAAAGVAIAGAAALKFGVSAVKAASDAQQSLGATETVFGKFAKTVIDTSDKAATKYGLSANVYRENANLLGSLLKNQGVAMDKLAGKTESMIGIGSDLAATFGGTTSDAVEALSSALKGEFDPLERYGISLKASTVTAAASALASKKYGKSLDDLSTSQQAALKQQATSNLIMKQSADSHGAFAKESNTLAHQQQVLGAQWDNLKVKLGSFLLPVITKVLTVINNNFVPAIKAMGDFLAPVVTQVKNFFSGLSSGSGTLGPVSTFIQGSFIPAVRGVLTAFQGLVGVVLPIVRQIATAIVGQWGKIKPYVQQVWTSVKQIIVGVMGIIKQVITVATNVITAVWKNFGGQILSFITKTFKNIAQFVGGIMKAIAGVVKLVLAVLKGDWSGAWNAMKQILSGVWQAIKAIVKQAINIVKTVLAAGWAVIKAGVSAAWNAIKAVISNNVANVINIVRGLKDRIIGVFSGAAGWLKSAGQAIINGLISGIDSAKQWLIGKIQALADLIPGWLKKRLGIASPSKVTHQIGVWIMEGLSNGLDKGSAGVARAIDKVIKVIEKVAKARTKTDEEAEAFSKHYIKAIKEERAFLMQNGREQDKITEKIGAAVENLKALKAEALEYASSIAEAIKETGNVTSFVFGQDEEGNSLPATANAIIAQLADRVKAAQEFNQTIQSLVELGLNERSVNDILKSGVEAGLPIAKAVMAGGKEAVTQINTLTVQLANTGVELGSKMSKKYKQAGIAAAEGVVAGLQSQRSRLMAIAQAFAEELAAVLAAAMAGADTEGVGENVAKGVQKGIKKQNNGSVKAGKKIGKAVTTGAKKKLKVRSPSRVFMEIGKNVTKGLAIGLDETYTKRAGHVLASSLQKGFGTPALDAFATQNASEGRGGRTYNITIEAPVGSSPADIGRTITKYIDAYERDGGRRYA